MEWKKEGNYMRFKLMDTLQCNDVIHSENVTLITAYMKTRRREERRTGSTDLKFALEPGVMAWVMAKGSLDDAIVQMLVTDVLNMKGKLNQGQRMSRAECMEKRSGALKLQGRK